jgi:hypothetical protein
MSMGTLVFVNVRRILLHAVNPARMLQGLLAALGKMAFTAK